MIRLEDDIASRFAEVARAYCRCCTTAESNDELALRLAQHLSELLSLGFRFRWSNAFAPDAGILDEAEKRAILRVCGTLRLRFYGEVFNILVLPPEIPVVGDLLDDLMDVYADVAYGLRLFDQGDQVAAVEHWAFWLWIHWGEHATSALRALFAHLKESRGD